MPKSLIIGMGIGKLYSQVLKDLNQDVITADPVAHADYLYWEDALIAHKSFDTVHICTPNFTHELIARKLANYTRLMFIEKPGLVSEAHWKKLIYDFPRTRIVMVKNNMWRDNIKQLQSLYESSNTVSFNWLNQNRIPKPGSWFTDKSKAFGGVSRDLLPHLLSLFAAVEPKYDSAVWLYRHAWQRFELKDINDSDYGNIDPNGIYNVDDNVELECTTKKQRCYFKSSWRTLSNNDIGIHFDNNFVELGLCPENAYQNMISQCLNNLDNEMFWLDQFDLDCWIHRMINL